MSRETTMPAPWREAAEKVGGTGALAAALGVGRTALHRWANGIVVPSPIVQAHVNAWFTRRGLAKPF